MRFFATAAKGTEPALRDELKELHLADVRADRGGVHFSGGLADAALACLWSRVAVRILLEVSQFDSPSEDTLYAGARRVDWAEWLTPNTTLAVRATCRSSRLTHSQYVAQKVKDAIVDSLRDRLGARPSVDRDDPDVLVAAHLARDRMTLYLDVGGSSLHERGWRARAGEAPLRETLAAAVVRLSGWDGRRPLVDPMCGAGTIAIEAAAWSRRIAPGLSREAFGFERWASHDDAMRTGMRALREGARASALEQGPPVVARDVDAHSVELARANAKAAGVSLVVEQSDVRVAPPPGEPGFVVTNPPYGERLAADAAFHEEVARALSRMRGQTVAVLCGAPELRAAIKRKPERWWLLYNGPIECRLLLYEMR
ncbi:MAG TPA: THUMP domain-containing protein [Polyangiaceae bacterium]